MAQKPPKNRITLSLLGIKAEAEGPKGIAALLVVAVLVLVARLAGLL
jgi:hypothetical protein